MTGPANGWFALGYGDQLNVVIVGTDEATVNALDLGDAPSGVCTYICQEPAGSLILFKFKRVEFAKLTFAAGWLRQLDVPVAQK